MTNLVWDGSITRGSGYDKGKDVDVDVDGQSQATSTSARVIGTQIPNNRWLFQRRVKLRQIKSDLSALNEMLSTSSAETIWTSQDLPHSQITLYMGTFDCRRSNRERGVMRDWNSRPISIDVDINLSGRRTHEQHLQTLHRRHIRARACEREKSNIVAAYLKLEHTYISIFAPSRSLVCYTHHTIPLAPLPSSSYFLSKMSGSLP